MSDGVGEARPEAEGELALARIALDSGETAHAAAHAGNAIASDPTLRDAYDLLDGLAATGDAVALFPVDGRVYIGAAAARSYLLARRGDLDEAFSLLCQAAAMMPGKEWAAGWLAPLADSASFASRLDPQRAAGALNVLAMALTDPADEPLIAPLRPFLDVARHLAAASPDRAGPLSLLSALARRLGAHEEAIAWSERAERMAPGYTSGVMLGYALRSAGRFDDAHHAWVRALRANPADVDLRTDIAELLARRGKLDEGIRWLDEGLALEPEHPKAFPSASAMRYLRDGDIAHLVRLADWWRAHPEHEYAGDALTWACQGRVWLGQAPWPSEAICNMLRQAIDDGADLAGMRDQPVRLTLSALEVPSAFAAVRSALPGLAYAVDPPAPAPDIRVPLATGRYRLWTYQGVYPAPAVPAPPRAAIAALHAMPSPRVWLDHPPAAYDAAVALAGLSVDDLLGLMAHVPPPPDAPGWCREVHRIHPAYWARIAQARACLGLLHCRPDEPWRESTRRAVLVDLTCGAEDWATDAAMYALVTAAWADPEIREDVASLIGHRFLDAMAAMQQRVVTIIGPMAHLVLATPGMNRDVAGLARDFLRRAGEEEEREAGHVAPGGGQPAGGTRPQPRRGLFRRR